MSSPLKKISEEIIHTNPWWNYIHDVFEFSDGRRGDYYYGKTNGMSIVVPIAPDGRVVLIKQYRYLVDKYSIEFPGGGIQKQEVPSAVAARELREETGYIAEEMINLSIFEPHNGLFVDTTHVFLAKGLSSAERISGDDTEFIEVLLRRPDEIEHLIRNNEIWDGQTLATWALARYYV